MKAIILILLASLATTTAQAQSEANDIAGEAAEVKYYSVEVIIFTYEEDVFTGSEKFLPDPLPDQDGAMLDDTDIPVFSDTQTQTGDADEDAQFWVVVPATSSAEFVARHVNDDEHPFRLALLRDDESMLADALRKFELLDAYETLYHVGWTQPAYDEPQTPPIDLSLFGRVPPALDGTLELYLSRYLHLIVDLELEAPESVAVAVDDDDSRFSFGDRFGRDEDIRRPVYWRIQEDRIFRNGEMRYFDHPKFGVLAKVVRVETPEDETGPDNSSGLFSR